MNNKDFTKLVQPLCQETPKVPNRRRLVVLAFNWSTNLDYGIDAFVFDTEAKCITKLVEVMKKFKDDRSLDTALQHAERNEINEALQVLDTWCEEYSSMCGEFTYLIKDGNHEGICRT
jgi:hypothetical protein